MICRLQRLCIVVTLMLSIGLHWTLLQSAAWVGMLVSYTQEGPSLKDAVAMTFDGAHPCELCKAVARGRDQSATEKPFAPQTKQEAKLVLALAEPPTCFIPHSYVREIDWLALQMNAAARASNAGSS